MLKCEKCGKSGFMSIMSEVIQAEMIDTDNEKTVQFGSETTVDGKFIGYHCTNCNTWLTDDKGENILDREKMFKRLHCSV